MPSAPMNTWTQATDGERVWQRILKAVDELLAKRPAPGQKVH
jgi:hypothetical protein